MKIDTSPIEYSFATDGLVEPTSLGEFVAAHHALNFADTYLAEHDPGLFKKFEWQNIRQIQDFQRDNITTKFTHGVLPWHAKNTGNCFTYSTRTAELLEMCGYEAAISFTNEHTFVLVRGAQTQTGFIYMLNPEERKLSRGEVSILSGDNQLFPLKAIRQIQSHGFSEPIATTMYTGPLRKHVAIINSADKYGKPTYETPWVEADFPATTIIGISAAKDALFKYVSLNGMLGIATTEADSHVQAVIDTVQALGEYNPQRETREKLNTTLKKFKAQIIIWSGLGVSSERINEVINAYALSLPHTFSREVFIGDLYRAHATKAKLAGVALGTTLTSSANRYKSAELAPTEGKPLSSGSHQLARAKLAKTVKIAKHAGVEINV